MNLYRADLHIHTLLSPCGSLEMSPVNIIEAALKAQLNIIGITDHNSTKQAPLVKMLGEKAGLMVICGAELNSSEEVHCLALFENLNQLDQFQAFIDGHMMPVKNKPELFGEQVVVDEDEMIVYEEKKLLITALEVPLIVIEQEVHRLGGVFIPAHIDRMYNGLFSQLGFLPENLIADAFELSKNANKNSWQNSGKLPANAQVIRSSDAHLPEQIGEGYTVFKMQNASFGELKQALAGINGRHIFDTFSA